MVTFSDGTLVFSQTVEIIWKKKKTWSTFVREMEWGIEYKSHLTVCGWVCVWPVPQLVVLYTDLDKFKMSGSIFYGSLISQSSSCPCTFVRLCVCVCGWEGRFDGLGDDYSWDHLFSGMRYSNKRLREREEVRWKRRESRTGVWRTTRQADSISLTGPNWLMIVQAAAKIDPCFTPIFFCFF